MTIFGSYGLGLFCRGVLLVYLAGAASSTPDDTKHVAAMHREPVIGPLPVPLMERRALRTNVSGSSGRQQPHGQRRQHPSNNGDGMSSSIRHPPTILEDTLSTSSSAQHPLCQQIEISESNLSGSESTRSSHPLGNVIDGDLGTRWATDGFASWLMIDLPEPTLLAGVAIDFGHKSKKHSNSQSFTMLVFGDYQVIHRLDMNAERMGGFEYVEFETEISARSVVLVGYGREGYTSLAEIQLCGGRVEAAPTSVSTVKEEESVSSPPGSDDYRSSKRRNSNHLRGGKSL